MAEPAVVEPWAAAVAGAVVPMLWPLTGWQVTTRSDEAVRALRSRHYSTFGSTGKTVGPPGRVIVLRTADGLAAWITHYPDPALSLDGLDAWRCSLFRNEGPLRSSDLIRQAMALTAALWTPAPPDGWVTWVEPAKVASAIPGWCFRRAGWRHDRSWSHPRLIRFRARCTDA